MITGFLGSLGALIAMLDRIESSLYDSVTLRLSDVADDSSVRVRERHLET
jgi:hypothetical protein